MEIDNNIIERIVSNNSDNDNAVVLIQDVQKEFGYVPEEALKILARRLDIPLVKLYGVATFYTQFKMHPEGKYKISMCRGTACHVKNSGNLLKHLEKKLRIASGETTKDNKFTLESVNCLGACAKAPAMMINESVYGDLTEEKIDSIIKGLE